MRIVFIAIICITIGCKSKNSHFSKKACLNYNNKYVEFASRNQIDSALFYVNKSIKCDKSNDFYKLEKVNLLVNNMNYENAINYLDEPLSNNNPVYKMFKGVLLLKIQKNEDAYSFLKEAHNEFNNIKNSSVDYNSAFYSLGLDNYFEEAYQIEVSISEYKQLFIEDSYALQTIEYAESLIKTYDKVEVLYKMFNIN